RKQDTNRIRVDVVNVSRQVRTLIPQAGTLMLNTGRECLLLLLGGTVAIFFRGTQYNIPVEIYITENYPDTPPMVYVRPTPGMALKMGHRHVDSAGFVYLPYLHEWNGRSHDLVQLCAHMSSIFGQDPPPPPSYQQQQPSPPRRNPSPPAAVAAVDPRAEAVRELTSKLQQELGVMYSRLREDIDAEFEAQGALQRSAEGVADDAAALRRQRELLADLISDAVERKCALVAYIAEEESRGETDPADLVRPSDALSRQALDLHAETLAVEDAMYFLDQAIVDGGVTPEEFLREIRRLARRQYACDALLRKVEAEQEAQARQRERDAAVAQAQQ
ncbi:unnamed protein product, partial [Phaeothamnion confervicola]